MVVKVPPPKATTAPAARPAFGRRGPSALPSRPGSSRSPGSRSVRAHERDPGLEPREVHPEADVRPVREGRLEPRVLPVGDEPVRLDEDGRVAVRGGERDADELATTDRRPAELDVPRRVPVDDRGRRLEPQRLLDDVRGERRTLRELRGREVARQDVPERVRDHPVGRLDPAEEQDGCVRDDLAAVERARSAGRRAQQRRGRLPFQHRLQGAPERFERVGALRRRLAARRDVRHGADDGAVPGEGNVGREVVEPERGRHRGDRERPAELRSKIGRPPRRRSARAGARTRPRRAP